MRIESGSTVHVLATVRGTRAYRVELARERQQIRASCTCPYFGLDVCKHIWAVIVAADSQGLLRGSGSGERLRLVPVEDDDDLDVDLSDGALAEKADDFHDLPQAPARLPGLRPATRLAPVGKPGRQISEGQSWRKQLARLATLSGPERPVSPEGWPAGREILYVVDPVGSRAVNGLLLEIVQHDLKKDGAWSKPKARYLPRECLRQLSSADDRHILACLAGATALYDGSPAYGYGAAPGFGTALGPSIPFRYRLRGALLETLIPALCRTGRCRLRLQPEDDEAHWLPVRFAAEQTWEFRLVVRRAEQGGCYDVRGELAHGGEHIDVSAPPLLLEGGFLFLRDRAARFEHHGAFEWIALLRDGSPLRVPVTEGEELVRELLRQPSLPPLDLPAELHYEVLVLTPRPRLAVKVAAGAGQRDHLHGYLSFDYGGPIVDSDSPDRGIVQAAERRIVLRDRIAELGARERLRQLGWRSLARPAPDDRSTLELAASRLPEVVQELSAAGWHVEAEGRVYRSSGRFAIGVRSGVDWFELHGVAEFGDATARLPELLAAVRRGERMVRLGDGSFGLLPEEWLKRLGLLAALDAGREDRVRFTRSQVALLDALLSAQPEVECDAIFLRMREELRGFSGIQPLEPPPGFKGELRPYQKEGLGWMEFLRRLGLGGCLADDMGLGKTVQVLALLEGRRELRHAPGRDTGSRVGPSLVVLPKSLVFNWKEEAARFAPRMRVLEHTGLGRRKGTAHFADYDLVLTTYGTLRRDAADLKEAHFDYVVLDEAQAIKNADSLSAKAARLLQADHRLALSGTPIENHVGELWSLLEFLNPGMLGAAAVLRLTGEAGHDADEGTRELFAQALRPLLLRRTKEQVVRDLPPKLEQTLYCELDGKQRRLYDELRDHYRSSLRERVKRVGLARSKLQILEALLRLRQAALHPGLLDERRATEPAAKLEVLLSRLHEAIEEGHKVLVFSQFTRMLGILRQSLDREPLAYAYLDGRTQDREATVARFQTDPDCKLFLISLKTGGLGLNLTAAQYVFLLDPWWNPAVEAQAIDRAHRIGQASRVFAYRLIARGTIEEKVLELQSEKRELAEAIVGADEGWIRTLQREDLERLLS